MPGLNFFFGGSGGGGWGWGVVCVSYFRHGIKTRFLLLETAFVSNQECWGVKGMMIP